MPNHKDRPLINAKKNMHSTLSLVNLGIGNLTGWKVKGNQITDDSDMVQGVWDAKRSVTGNQSTELRLLLKCKTAPQTRKKVAVDPPTGTVTITLENPPAKDQTVTQQVDYANDDQPP
jgi:hypothetical protein